MADRTDESGMARWLTGAVVAAVVIAGIALVYAATRPATVEPPPAEPHTPSSPGKHASPDRSPTGDHGGTHAESRKELFTEALAGRATVKCTYHQKNRRGTTYLRGTEKLRLDFTTDDGQHGHLLQLGNTRYSWTEDSRAGLKSVGGPNDQFGQAMSQVTVDQLVRKTRGKGVRCTRAARGESVFRPPRGITFHTATG